MTPAEIEAVLQEVFEECHAVGSPLDAQQREILFLMPIDRLSPSTPEQTRFALERRSQPSSLITDINPLDELTLEQRQTLLQFIQEQNYQNRSWKAQLLNDWLHDRNSGAIQFVRELYGLKWLERVQSQHLAHYADEIALTLSVGDRIEVSNGLWEWVQDDGPCSREWFPCTVISLTEVMDAATFSSTGYSHQTNCTVRFDNGMEYEIQGIYEWNRYNWQWAGLGNRD